MKTLSLLLGLAMLSGCFCQEHTMKKDEQTRRIENVQSAMLAMQRYSWEQGVAAQALLEMGKTDLVVQFAREAVHRQGPDGRLSLMGDDHGVTDPACAGQAVLAAAAITGDLAFKEAVQKMLDYLLHRAPRTSDGTLYHLTDKPQVWIDSMYMAPPFLAAAGYPRQAVAQIEGFRKRLLDPEKKLYSHIWDEGKNEFIRRDFWGVGNGWTVAGITRVIRLLPADMTNDKTRLIHYVKELIDASLPYMRDDGLFHDVLDNPQTFVETNFSQMLAYAIYRGLEGGYLDESYRPYADKMRAAAIAKVDKYGLVQGVCGAPNFNTAGTATEGQAFFLLMEAAYAQDDSIFVH